MKENSEKICIRTSEWVTYVVQWACSEILIPVKTGIQKNSVHASRLDSGVRRNDDSDSFRTGLINGCAF